MEPTAPELESALLKWINTFELHDSIKTWKDLEDGRVLWEVLRQIDSGYFAGKLPENSKKPGENWIPRWQNLKHIERAVTTYIREECNQLPFLSKDVSIDLKAIAINASAEHSSGLLRWVLLTAFYSPHSNTRQVKIMEELGQRVMQPIAKSITEMEAEDRRLAQILAEQEVLPDDNGPDGESSLKNVLGRDPELELEEMLIQASKENKHLGERVTTLTGELERMHTRIYTLQEELAESRLALDRTGNKSEDPEAKQLRDDAIRDKEYIAGLEADFSSANSRIESQERQIERLKRDASTKQDLRDELQVIKSERDELIQKANANENLKKKIQSLQNQESTTQFLQEELQVTREQVQELDALKERFAALKKAHDESSETIANGEQEIFDQKTTRKRLEHDIKILTTKYEQAQGLFNREQESNAELQGKIRELEAIQSSGVGGVDSLEDELAGADKQDDSKINISAATEGSLRADELVLKQKLDVSLARCSKLEAKYMEVLQENLGLQTSIGSPDGPKSDDPFVKQRERLQEVEAECAEFKRKLFESSRENSDLTRRALTAEAILKEQTSVEIQQIRKTLATELESLNSNHTTLLARFGELQAHCDDLEEEVEEQKSLCRYAMLSRNNIQLDSEDDQLTYTIKIIRKQLDNIRTAPPSESATLVDETSAQLAGMISDGKKQVAKAEKMAEELERSVQSLQRELDRAEKGNNQATKVANMQQELTNVKRELKLMVPAWYDLVSRVQTNNVVVHRRPENASSWTVKQRVAVGQGGSHFRR